VAEEDMRVMVADDTAMMIMGTEEVTDTIIETDITKKTALIKSGFLDVLTMITYYR
jgi:hypothetical protein